MLGLLFCSIPLIGELLPLGSKMKDAVGNNYKWKDYTLNLRVEGNKFILYFLDKEKYVVEPPVASAIVRYEGTRFIRVSGNKAQRLRPAAPENQITVRREGDLVPLVMAPDNNALISEKYILPRPLYWVVLSLIQEKDGKNEILQSYERQRLVRQDQVADEPASGNYTQDQNRDYGY